MVQMHGEPQCRDGNAAETITGITATTAWFSAGSGPFHFTFSAVSVLGCAVFTTQRMPGLQHHFDCRKRKSLEVVVCIHQESDIAGEGTKASFLSLGLEKHAIEHLASIQLCSLGRTLIRFSV